MSQFDNITISPCATFHLREGRPLYALRFLSVLKFASVGLAAVRDPGGAYHINTLGKPAYCQRYDHCYNFYHALAAVELNNKFFHINTDGTPAYQHHFSWVGNFQENLCVVKDHNTFYHINRNGQRIYQQVYDYVGDFKDGIAVVYKEGCATHIDNKGQYIHNKWFKNLDVYHKGFARAEDDQGWFHIDRQGNEIYADRYKDIEPFYNDLAKVQTYTGALLQINPANDVITIIAHANVETLTEKLSDDLVGFWKTFVIYTGVKLNIFDYLPATLETLVDKIAIPSENLTRILRALWEIHLLTFEPHTALYKVTDKGQLLQRFEKESFLAAAAILWANVAAQDWSNLPTKLALTLPSHPSFKDHEVDEQMNTVYLQALEGYAIKDIGKFLTNSPLLKQKLIGFGRSSLGVMKYLARLSPLNAAVFVGAQVPSQYLQPTNLQLIEDLEQAKEYEVGLLCRFLHYFDDNMALAYLDKMFQLNIKKLLVFETILSQDKPTGGLLDINMLMETGGKLRTVQQWQQLFHQSHYSVVAIDKVHPYLSLLQVTL